MPEPTVTPLERSGDRKTSFLLRRAGTKYLSVVANTHGLPAGISCPGRTTVCAGPSSTLPTAELEQIAATGEKAAGRRGPETTWRRLLPLHGIDPTFPCYVVADLRHGTEENASYRNWARLKPILNDTRALTAHLLATLDEFLTEAKDHDVAPYYRFHWDGDIATPAMAEAIAAALTERPTVHAWLYTRSLFAIPHLAPVPNLVTYFSVDAGNVDAAATLLNAHPNIRVAVLGHDDTATADLLATLGRRPAPICPVDTGKLPVVTAAGAARTPGPHDAPVGACAMCRLCVHGRADVRFTLRKTPFTPKTITPTTRLDEPAGRTHHFAKRPHVERLFNTLIEHLTDLGDPVTTTWSKTYVTVHRDGAPLLRAQARGNRLLLVYPHRPAGTRRHARLRDLTGQRHQCPGVLELTVTTARHLPAAVRLAARMPRSD